MSQRAKRIANAFLLGAGGAFLLLLIDHYGDLSKAVQSHDWASAQGAIFVVASGAILAGLRAVQSYVAAVPSPEADEN